METGRKGGPEPCGFLKRELWQENGEGSGAEVEASIAGGCVACSDQLERGRLGSSQEGPSSAV